MTSLDPVRGTIVERDDVELERWIADGWVRPRGLGGSDAALKGIDIARIQLIHELRALDLNDDAMPVVLGLLDQIYALRRRMRLVRRMLLALSPELRRSLLDKLAAERERDRQSAEA